MPELDDFAKRHLENWLDLQFEDEDERDNARAIILQFMDENPWSVDPDRLHLNITYFEMLDRGKEAA